MLFKRNSWLKDKQLINITIVRSLNDSEKGFIVSGQRLRTLGCCITTMLPVTLPSPWTNVWTKRVFQWFRSPHTHLILSPCDFFLFPKFKFHFKSHHFGTVDNIQKVVTNQLRVLSHEDFSTATGSGSNICGGVWFPKGITLKGIMLICSSVVNKKIL